MPSYHLKEYPTTVQAYEDYAGDRHNTREEAVYENFKQEVREELAVIGDRQGIYDPITLYDILSTFIATHPEMVEVLLNQRDIADLPEPSFAPATDQQD